ncbi:Ubiquitin carboxyl-terminal hydrolase isozyme L3 [Madurella mycetomatis]|uniref:Ubiquitin carboxyl-terminal hydrolase n=1 Tax=Madurella mycetomatis TaxID=100816 RepID=A0A175W157_9PEZI|nr:Ubiquitin carboxyl-terminal hydrolase isozyme L3 [Madurella mycetomatis]
MAKKHFTVLENNPEVMNALAKKLGLSDDLAFYDVYSLDEPDLLAHIPRPAYALLVIIPLTPAWKEDRRREDAELGDPVKYYRGGAAGTGDEPIIWFKQTIADACGSYGLLHSAINGPTSKFILPGSTLEQLRNSAIPLAKDERAQMLYDSKDFEEAHQSVAGLGDTPQPEIGSDEHRGQHFVAYVKANGHLWELEGSRNGPLDRGELGEDDDVLSPKALELGLKRIIRLELESGGQDLRFSCIALAPRAG